MRTEQFNYAEGSSTPETISLAPCKCQWYLQRMALGLFLSTVLAAASYMVLIMAHIYTYFGRLKDNEETAGSTSNVHDFLKAKVEGNNNGEIKFYNCFPRSLWMYWQYTVAEAHDESTENLENLDLSPCVNT